MIDEMCREAKILADLFKRALIRECIPYNKFSYRKPEMQYEDREKGTINVYTKLLTEIDYCYSEYIEEGSPTIIKDYIENHYLFFNIPTEFPNL
eukprot:gnl/Chilomastix_caulleri/3956.p1 GENE.gnl/Chilomastix_caulleri/3956~~gnl/Chilomastix_caulleri/3956.p1  ORF type:complete len:94 (-),score=26.32 gnl/Chilomastix_caulleri/3956:117-398(-)